MRWLLLLLLLLSSVQPSHANLAQVSVSGGGTAPALVNSYANCKAGGPSQTVSCTVTAVGTGNSLIFSIVWCGSSCVGSASGQSVTSIALTGASGATCAGVEAVSPNTIASEMWRCTNAGGATSALVTIGGGTSDFLSASIFEVSNDAGLDGTSGASNPPSGTSCSMTASTTHNNSLIMSMNADATGVSTSGWTYLAGSNSTGVAVASSPNTAAGPQTVTWTGVGSNPDCLIMAVHG